ncbi:MAG: ferric iron uptake transcriptional regulator [Gammaproteobacteria bacterium]|nr:MAG: ferric iron uptake transcriptional regulator [Gammaproteobacteria bacterium]
MSSSELKSAGLKATLPRIKILEIMQKNREAHMRAEEVYQALREDGEDVGLATVYRVLTQFEDAGLVIRHHFEGGHAVFEFNEGRHHDHLVCVKSGKVIEFTDPIIEERQKAIAKEHGFKMTDHTLIIYGVSADYQDADD